MDSCKDCRWGQEIYSLPRLIILPKRGKKMLVAFFSPITTSPTITMRLLTQIKEININRKPSTRFLDPSYLRLTPSLIRNNSNPISLFWVSQIQPLIGIRQCWIFDAALRAKFSEGFALCCIASKVRHVWEAADSNPLLSFKTSRPLCPSNRGFLYMTSLSWKSGKILYSVFHPWWQIFQRSDTITEVTLLIF